MFKKILIANRGEIACRVIKTARRMGIKTVAVYSEAESNALHVQQADEAVCIGAAPSSESYLRVDKLLKAIKDSGAEAVHPGYGFLSENAAFARRLAKEGIAFIGPPPAAIGSMGDKIKSKKLADKAGVNTIPGHADALKDARQAVSVARKIGYPVMLKASAGGGGKGMRIVRNDQEAKDGFHSAVREAKSSFGDDRILAEKFIEQPRHIEIQVLADSHGNAVYLGERECSIQRRHQKVIEEAPSPFIDETTRKAMGEQAVALAMAVKYASAGTVEFIVDGERNFYFLEMNTRLQVEHPVTEMIYGLDLVELMIRVAAGEKLPLTQKDVKADGWAVEARVYAENPARNFLPSVGRLVHYIEPEEDAQENNGVRVDSGVYEGGEISIHYDPMIAKLVAHGADRKQAIARLRSALDAYLIRGISHNIAFLSAVLAHPRFASGNISTGFIDEEFPNGFDASSAESQAPAPLIAAAAAVHLAFQIRATSISALAHGRRRKVRDKWAVLIKGIFHHVTVTPADGGYDVSWEDNVYEVRTGWAPGAPLFHARINEQPCCLQVERRTIGYRLIHAGIQDDILVLSPRAAELYALMPVKPPALASKNLLSPMPGLLVSVAVSDGQAVKAGEELATIEAMKMENVLRAERDGVVASIRAQSGDILAVDDVIVEFQ